MTPNATKSSTTSVSLITFSAISESVPYHKLLLMYGGEIAPEELLRQDANTADGTTILYGIGNWYFVNGQTERARPLWQKVLDGNQQFAFGYIAAEAEMARATLPLR